MKSSYIAEFFGSMGLLIVVVGSGIMGELLAQGNTAIALLANSLATGAGLYVLIQVLAPISGAHFNPVVSLVEWKNQRLQKPHLFYYLICQVLGAICGVWLTHLMFGLDVFQLSLKNRSEMRLLLSEFIASFGLISTILLSRQHSPGATPMAVALYITGAYWFTSSTSFANPAVTIARSLTNTFSGIHWTGVVQFILAQLIAALCADLFVHRVLKRH